ncbi:hypothetical protein IIE63_000739 [Listeria monocytogenes]|uniref:Uncharacterized protein n=1 Tax=Listeria monocytogenes TaxID=1639 RepID=A0A823IY74_LISMN|nr:hypothetical protein [Listeria monocytogenes]EAG9222933.1 hypothetical protein [Listeria monocytogenes]EAG9354833.1 hypothetical protein [Listeria monocytogenes]EGN0214371.1 hypothetical protein [Listeria monocytogenes]OET20119.1 hypothetical protein AJL11_03110 [Listeria monocytogenes]OFG93486.1 hypothetical protein BJM83_06735 [Listeria monocytogenes]
MELKLSKKGMIITGIIISLVIIIIASILGFQHHQATIEHEKEIQKQNEAKQLIKKKEKNFNTALGELYFNGSTAATDAEELGDAYLKVWTDAIFEDKGAEIDGKNYNDFNDAIEAQRNQFTTDGKIDSLDTQTDTLRETITKLKDNVTDKNKSLLDEANDYYTKLRAFIILAREPTGNVTTYSTSYNNSKTDYIASFNNFPIDSLAN